MGIHHHHDHGHPHGGHGHAHAAHDHASAHQGRALIAALIITFIFMLVEVASGVYAHSLALVADAGHMLTDAAALGLALGALRFARRPADGRRSFGYQRSQVLATSVNGVTLFLIVAWIAVEAIQRLLSPVEVDAQLMIVIGALGAAVNVAVFLMLRRGAHDNMNIAAATVHVLGDLLGSVAAVAAGIAIRMTAWTPIDPLLSLLVCALIAYNAWGWVRRSAHILMEGSPEGLDVEELRATLERHVPAIRDVHHVHCWSLGAHERLVTLHATVEGSADHALVLRQANEVLAHEYGITHATIQIEPVPCEQAHCGPGMSAAG